MLFQQIKNTPWFEWPIKIKLLISALLFFWVLFMFYIFSYAAQFKTIESTQQQINQLIRKTVAVDEYLGQAPEYLDQQEKFITASRSILNKQQPTSNLSELLSALSTIAFQNNVNITLMKPTKPTEVKSFKAIPIQLNLQSDYFGLLAFFLELTKLNFILSFDEITSEKSNQTLVTDLTILSYWI